MTRNPFRYGAPVESDCFCDRSQELEVLIGRMRSGVHAFLLSPRRYGKTSLVLTAARRLRAEGGRAAYVNLLLCTTEDEVASVVLTAVVREALRPAGRARRTLEEVLRHIRVAPRVGLGLDGSVSVSFDPVPAGSGPPWVEVLVDAVDLLESATGDSGAALVLDEFQAIADIGPHGLGGVFKALADRTRHASLVFSGSHLSVMERLTHRPGAPLLGMGETLRLEVIAEPAMVDYLTRRARAAGKELPRPVAAQIYQMAGAVPNDVQWLAYSAFEAARDARGITPGDVVEGMAAIVAHQAGAFAERFEVLAPVQQRIVRELARGPVAHVYAKSFLDATRVANANAVRTALAALSHAEIARRVDGAWRLASPFFGAWLTSQQTG